MGYYLLLLALFAARKVLDQSRSKRNIARLERDHRVKPAGDRAFPLLLVTHVTFFISTPLEVVLLDRPFLPALGLPMLTLFAGASLLRHWSIAALGAHWSSQVVVPEDLVPVTGGPYRYLRHPNYLAMSLELFSLGLMHSAWISTAVVTGLNALAVYRRILAEEATLFQVPAYRDAMGPKSRLIPGVW